MSGDHNMRGEDHPVLTAGSSRVNITITREELAALVKEVDVLKALLADALYALEYAADMTKPADMSGCDCPICTTITKLKGLK